MTVSRSSGVHPFPFFRGPKESGTGSLPSTYATLKSRRFCWQAAQWRPLRINTFNIVFFGEFCAVGGVVGDHTALAVAHEENLGAGLGTCVFQGLVYHFLLGGQFPVFTSAFSHALSHEWGSPLRLLESVPGMTTMYRFCPVFLSR